MKKINILSPGRFHVCDLARELDRNGFDVKFYSFVPTKRAEKFGLPRHCSHSLVYLLALFLALEKVFFKRKQWAKRVRINAQDFLTGLLMRKCDILIAMSGDYVYSLKRAQTQGATIILERGSKHILTQREVLEAIPSLKGNKPVPDINVTRELIGYNLADYIAIASQHVYDSFTEHNYPIEKLFKNPYGVDLSMFCPQPTEKTYDVIMVGGWSYRKGCDLIIEALKGEDIRFLHVGGIVDLEFPQEANFDHVDSVDQKELINYYNKAKVFLLPSREEGLAMVQAQAIACNLPLIGSKDSGAVDLQRMVEDPSYVTIIESYTAESVRMAVQQSLAHYPTLGSQTYAGDAIKELTWKAYGKRYANFLRKTIK